MSQVTYKRGKHPNSRPDNRKYKINNETLYVDNDIPGNEASQHSSMYISHMHKMGHADSAITKYKIKCIPLSCILPHNVDYLQVDTEGHDDRILMGCNFNNFNVLKIEYEYIHIGDERNTKLLKCMGEFGYQIVKQTQEDIILEKTNRKSS